MAAITLSGQFQTITAPTASPQTVNTRDRWVKLKNLGVNAVQVANLTDLSTNTAGTSIAVGARTSLLPCPAGPVGPSDTVWLKPNTSYVIQAANADTLVSCEEFATPKERDSGA